MAESPLRSWDLRSPPEKSTFFYDDATVQLRVGDKQFKVSHGRLYIVSPVFKTMFSLPPTQEPPVPVELHNNPDDFTRFVWFIHLNPVQFKDYELNCPPHIKFTTVLGIATIAHMYECADILDWDTTEVLAALERRDREITVTTTLMSKVYHFAARFQDNQPPESPITESDLPITKPSLLSRAREVWADLVCMSSDPVEWLVAARLLESPDEQLQAVALFYILRRRPQDTHNMDSRLTGKDGQRLLIGAYNLSITSTSPLPTQGQVKKTFDGAWQGRYDPKIRVHRDQLWRLFNDAPWRMVDVNGSAAD